MKIKKLLATALTLSLILVSLTACGNPVKDDFKEYVNNNVITNFLPEYNAVAKTYTDVIQSQDVTAIIDALKEELPTNNKTLLEKLEAYAPKTPEVQELHNIFISAVEIRQDAYAQLLGAFTSGTDDESIAEAGLARLGESDTKLTEFQTKIASMKKDLGLVDAK